MTQRIKGNEFMIGCNYWASNAGVYMWREWDESVVDDNVKKLKENGIDYMRVFPTWSDFQPVHPFLKGGPNKVEAFIREDGTYFKNPCYLDETMIERFGIFCDICEKYDMKLIVGLITGFMSGRMFMPPALYGKNLITDPTSLYLQQKFIEGMVKEFKNKSAIYAWDLGNECNSMSKAPDVCAAKNWTMTVSNTIRAYDNSRPIISGMHAILPDSEDVIWTIEGQAEGCDILTTHSYPYWVAHAYKDKNASIRTAMHATCETKFYAEVGGKPCFVEEIGSMGNMLCDDEKDASFMRLNLLSNWANGGLGVMWWCAHEQSELRKEPYISCMCEVELGMLDINMKPKPILKETKRIGDIIKSFDFELPKADVDAVCILTRDQDSWGVAYMTYILARQAGLNIQFCYSEYGIPEAKRYILPSYKKFRVIARLEYLKLQQRVKDGAELYISADNGLLTEFEDLTGLHITDSCDDNFKGFVKLNNIDIPFERIRFLDVKPTSASIIAYDNKGLPAISESKIGKGRTCFVNFPLERMLLDEYDAFSHNRHLIYKELFKECIAEHIVISDNEYTCVTIHRGENEIYAVVINYSGEDQRPELIIKDGYMIESVIYGDAEMIPSFDAAILKIKAV